MAPELVQEAWVRLAVSEIEGLKIERPEAFVMRVAINLSIDARRRQVSHGEEVQAADAVLVDATPSVEARVLGRERMVRLTDGLARLTPKTRNIFLSHRLGGMSCREIAEAHGIGVSAVHQHIAKATLRLTTWMEGW